MNIILPTFFRKQCSEEGCWGGVLTSVILGPFDNFSVLNQKFFKMANSWCCMPTCLQEKPLLTKPSCLRSVYCRDSFQKRGRSRCSPTLWLQWASHWPLQERRPDLSPVGASEPKCLLPSGIWSQTPSLFWPNRWNQDKVFSKLCFVILFCFF